MTAAACNDTSLDALREETRAALDTLRGMHEKKDVDAARALLSKLRNYREHERLMELAEAIGRVDPDDATARRLYAQALIETGKVTAAIDVLQALLRRKGHGEALEAAGLLGRCYKQIFFDSRDRASASAKRALKLAVAAYRKPYERDPSNTWHGVNLLALAANCRRLGVRIDPKLDPRVLAGQLLDVLSAPSYPRDCWYLPTLAEVSLGTQDWSKIESILQQYVTSPDVQAFQLQSTLRQFVEIWELERDPRGRALVDVLRARLMTLPGGVVEISPRMLQRVRAAPPPDEMLEALLGHEGTKTYRWWRAGLDCALSVAAVCHDLSGRIGSGFLVSAADLGLDTGDETVVLTNFHVVNPDGAAPGIPPEAASIVFEGYDPPRTYRVAEVLWCSPPARCDASVLRLSAPVVDIAPLPIAKRLPLLGVPPARVYVIGHPGGRDLAFSCQDNELLDHEGPDAGKPQIAGVCRVHYRAPTEGGSSGSPVFNSDSWQVIALHHMGGKLGMPKLNGVAGTYAANEGIWIQSIVEQIRQTRQPSRAAATRQPQDRPLETA